MFYKLLITSLLIFNTTNLVDTSCIKETYNRNDILNNCDNDTTYINKDNLSNENSSSLNSIASTNSNTSNKFGSQHCDTNNRTESFDSQDQGDYILKKPYRN